MLTFCHFFLQLLLGSFLSCWNFSTAISTSGIILSQVSDLDLEPKIDIKFSFFFLTKTFSSGVSFGDLRDKFGDDNCFEKDLKLITNFSSFFPISFSSRLLHFVFLSSSRSSDKLTEISGLLGR